MKRWWYVLVVGVFVGLFGWAYVIAPKDEPQRHSWTEAGLFENYGYTITTTAGQKTRTAIFSPSIKNDDALVVDVLRSVTDTAFDQELPETVEPAVEVLQEHNYITFAYAGTKTYFQLYKNSSGEVGSVTFWQDGPSGGTSNF